MANENTREQKLKIIFATNPAQNVVFMTSDDRAFFNPADAKERSGRLKDRTVKTYNRKSLEADEKLAKDVEKMKVEQAAKDAAEKAKKDAAEKAKKEAADKAEKEADEKAAQMKVNADEAEEEKTPPSPPSGDTSPKPGAPEPGEEAPPASDEGTGSEDTGADDGVSEDDTPPADEAGQDDVPPPSDVKSETSPNGEESQPARPAEPTEAMTKEQLADWLNVQDVEFNLRDTKPVLLGKAQAKYNELTTKTEE